jgi:hypothetical protein
MELHVVNEVAALKRLSSERPLDRVPSRSRSEYLDPRLDQLLEATTVRASHFVR